MLRDDLADLSPAPAALLDAGPDLARARVLAAGGVAREVFSQAEGVFGRAEASRAEFASWLHFAAKVLGRDAYAERIADAEPGMPWRTVWAWWRPVGAHRAEPNLSGDWSVEVHDPEEAGDGGPLLKVWSLWTADRWFDLATGEPRPEPAGGAYAKRAAEAEEDGPLLFDEAEEGWALYCPATWEEPIPLGGGRFLLAEERGVFVAERNEAVVAAGWPSGGAEHGPWEEGDGSPWFAGPSPAETPLDAARLDAVFGADVTLRVAPERLPAALTHLPTRELLTSVGLPRHWAAGVSSFTVDYDEQDPAVGASGLLRLGTFELAYADYCRVLVRADTGEVLMRRFDGDEDENGDENAATDDETGAPAPFARDTETFLRLLEAIRRHMGACWSPYPCENGSGDFEDEVEALEPSALDTGTPGGEVWEHLFAAITELSVYGY